MLYPNPAVIWPVCVRAGAFGEQQPARDLWVSPNHTIFVDGALVPALSLVQWGEPSTQGVVPKQVEYWHLELDSHDIVLAEGLPSESYLDSGYRAAFFENGGAFMEAFPDFQPQALQRAVRTAGNGGPETAGGPSRTAPAR